jgi:hypothetical protein
VLKLYKEYMDNLDKKEKKFVDFVEDKELAVFDELSELNENLEKTIEILSDGKLNYENLIKEVVSRVPKPKDGETPTIDYKKIIDAVLAEIEVPEAEKVNYERIISGIEVKKQTPEETRDALESLEGEERLDAKAIKGLVEVVKENTPTRVGWGAHPLTVQADGVVKDKNTRNINFKGTAVTSVVRQTDGTVDVTLTGSAGAGSGDVVGPASATDNAIARFDTTTGKLIQNSAVTIADTTGIIAGTQGVIFSGATSGTTTVVPTAIAGTTTLTLPAATDTLVGKATTDTLTNKTIDANGTGNSITNLEVADFAATAIVTAAEGLASSDNDTSIPTTAAVIDGLDAKQPLDADLTTIAGLTATTDNFIQSKSSAWASRTPTQVTADLIAFVGDSGAGGVKGLVPAPASGDATAGKFLKADGTWTAPAGSGNVTKVGTPVNNQIGVWTGDGTIEGDSALTFDTTTDNLSIAASGKLSFGAVDILTDSTGTTTLNNIDALDATTESTIESAIDTLANLTSIQGRTVTLADAGANAIFGWDDVAGAYENLTASEATATLNNFTGDSGAGGVKGLVPAPAAGDAAASKFLKADGTWTAIAGGGDMLKSTYDTDNNGVVDESEAVIVEVRKGSAGTITKGQTVYLSGYNVGGWAEVELADANGTGTMPAIGIAQESITNAANAHVIVSGILTGIDTSAFAVNDALFVSETAGALTATRPTGATSGIQTVARVLRSNAVTGTIMVVGAGRTNAQSNLTDAKIWVGNATNQPTEVSVSGDATMANTGALTVANDAISNAKLANMATQTIKGRTTAGTGDPEDLTATQATAILNEFTGDSGAGGVKGLVKAPVAGDATKFLKGDGTWGTPAGSGNVTKVGTPVDNQVGVWTGDGTIEGDTALTFNTATDKLSVGGTSGSLDTGTIELGHATDTTLSRVSAGVVAIEGVNIETTATTANSKKRSIVFDVNGGGSAITTGQKGGIIRCPVAGTITAYSISVDTGTCTVKFWKKATGTAIPTVSDNINTSGVAISSGTHVYSTTVTDFTSTAVTANDLFALNITAVSSATKITVQLDVTAS